MMNLGRGLLLTRCLTRFLSTSALRCKEGGYLSESYYVNDAWNKRLESPLLQKIDPDEFFFEIDKKFQSDKVISAVDVDLFMNKVTSDEFIEELEELAYRLRKSPAAAEALPSTSHAIIRALMDVNRLDVAMRMLDDRMNYGVFTDYFTANILMDKFLTEGNFRDAAKIASLNMLQEDFGGSTTKLLSVLSCLKYIENPTPTPWAEDPPPDPRETAKEETKIKVAFLRNPGFDDHFDLSNPEHIVGKTLAYASFGLTEVDDVVRRSIEVLGWALYDKWERVENLLKMAADKKTPLSSETLKKITSLAESRLQLIESSPDKALPRPKLKRVPGMNLDKASVDELFARLALPDYSKIIPAVLSVLQSNKIPSVDVNVTAATEEALKKAVAEYGPAEAEKQRETYKDWETKRYEVLEEQVRRLKNEQRLQEIQQQKRELKEKEEVIFFYDNEEEWMMKQPPKERVYRMRFRGKYKPPKVKEDETYVPPVV